MYIRSGSDIRLLCTVQEMPEPPTHFTWFKGSQIFSHQSHASYAHRVALETSQHGMENHLSIRSAETLDSGNYTCIPAGAEPASIVVHVLNGSFLFIILCFYRLWGNSYIYALGCHQHQHTGFVGPTQSILDFTTYLFELTGCACKNAPSIVERVRKIIRCTTLWIW